MRGWAIPTATDIAFALAVLAVIGTHLPAALRSFLLTLAVVDDLVAITIIAVFYTESLDLASLALAAVPLGLFAFLVQRRIAYPAVLVPLALATWLLVHNSGIHATVAGVLLGLTVPVRARQSGTRLSTLPAATDVAHSFEHRLRPCRPESPSPSSPSSRPASRWSAAAWPTPSPTLLPSARGGRPGGGAGGVLGGTRLFARFTRAELDQDLAWSDLLGLSLLAGIGFTVSLLVGSWPSGQAPSRTST